jgi:N-acetylmuramoyl-L-alanine amidase
MTPLQPIPPLIFPKPIKRHSGPVETLFVHHSATPRGRLVSVEEIHGWHLKRGWSGIGYHLVIDADGVAHAARPLEFIGAGVAGHNDHSLHVCVVGDGREGFTEAQWEALRGVIRHFWTHYPNGSVWGHREARGQRWGYPEGEGAATLCPGFDVGEWLRQGMPVR